MKVQSPSEKDDALTQYVRLRHQAMDLSDPRHSASDGHYLETARAFFTDFAALHAQWERGDGAVPDSVWIETVSALSPEYRKAAEIVRKRDSARGREHYDTLRGYWEAMLQGRAYLGMPAVVGGEPAAVDGLVHHALLHNYSALLIGSYHRSDRKEGVELAYSTVLPLRRKVAALRNSEVAYRLTVQVILRGIGGLAAQSVGKYRNRLETMARELLSELEQSAMARSVDQEPRGTLAEMN